MVMVNPLAIEFCESHFAGMVRRQQCGQREMLGEQFGRKCCEVSASILLAKSCRMSVSMPWQSGARVARIWSRSVFAQYGVRGYNAEGAVVVPGRIVPV